MFRAVIRFVGHQPIRTETEKNWERNAFGDILEAHGIDYGSTPDRSKGERRCESKEITTGKPYTCLYPKGWFKCANILCIIPM